LTFYIGTNCPQVEMKSSSGKKRKILAGNIKDIFRIIQSIPSPKAEPFKLWLAEVGKERIDEIIDPELTIDRALETYLKKGYSREWILSENSYNIHYSRKIVIREILVNDF